VTDSATLRYDWLVEREGERLECKEAKSRFSYDDLEEYCAAIANEGGGRIVLGVTDKPPRRIVGTAAFPAPEKEASRLTDRLRYVKVRCEEVHTPSGRVLIFHVPSRPRGILIEINGRYLMRAGDSLRPMTQDQVRRIVLETEVDFSAETCPESTIDDLDPAAIREFQSRWSRKAGRPGLLELPPARLLADAELLAGGRLVYAAVILFGTPKALTRHLSQAETIFEYRMSEASIRHVQREEFRAGFFLWHDRLWELINLRNEVLSYQDGLFRWDMPAHDEETVREAVMNAVSHRDYRRPGSIMVRQWPGRLDIVSPGCFPGGITEETILFSEEPRNRRIAETLQRSGLIERSGQGADLIFRKTVESGKPLPDYSRSDDSKVWLMLRGEIQSPELVRFFRRSGNPWEGKLWAEDLVIIDLLYRNVPVWGSLRGRLPALEEMGMVERLGRGRGVRHLLSQKFYSEIGRAGAYTRRRGLSQEAVKSLLLEHIRTRGGEGASFQEFQDISPNLSRRQIQFLLSQLREAGLVAVSGERRWARWRAALTNVSGSGSGGG
jgi:ATP-dependent DNA helicase RecG